jgi:hypothetical protein
MPLSSFCKSVYATVNYNTKNEPMRIHKIFRREIYFRKICGTRVQI